MSQKSIVLTFRFVEVRVKLFGKQKKMGSLLFLLFSIITCNECLSSNVTLDTSFNCRLSSGPSNRYPISLSFYSEYNIPPLPKKFFPNVQIYYIYFNMWFNPDGTKNDNQFVPQLMLGHALCNSTNSGNYTPSSCFLNEWYIQSQYYFTTNNTKTSHAVTGDMIKVEENDTIYTQFIYDTDQYIWTLNIGIVNTNIKSTVIATEPYMGLLSDNTTSWNEAVYQTAWVGCDWELKYLEEKDNFPLYMNYTVTLKSEDNNGSPGNWWREWGFVVEDTCNFEPQHVIQTATNEAKMQQVVTIDLFYNESGEDISWFNKYFVMLFVLYYGTIL